MSNGGVNVAALGLGGIDTTTLVSSLVSIASEPGQLLQQKQSNVQAASSSISAFSSNLSALKNAAVALSTSSSFQAMSATSSDPSVVASTSSSGGAAAAGQWSVAVTQLAQSQRSLSNGVTDNTAALGMSGTLNISIGGGAATPITLTANESLNDLANAIASSGLRIQASTVFDGSKYHLLVSGLDTGGSNAISFDESQLTFGANGSTFSLGWDSAHDPHYSATSTIQSAQDAIVQIGGAHGYSVTSKTNQITNAIPGVTLAVTQQTTTPATITVASDTSTVQNNVQAFVNAYNTVVYNGHASAGFGTTKAANSLLQGDNAIRSSLSQMGDLISQVIPGTTGAYTTLGSVGISLNADGSLSFDSSKFTAAMQADPTSVQRLFVTDSTSGATGVMSTLGAAIDRLTDPVSGAVTAEINSFSAQNTTLGKEITDAQNRVNDYQTLLQTEFAQMNAAVAQYKQVMNAIDPSSSSSSSSK